MPHDHPHDLNGSERIWAEVIDTPRVNRRKDAAIVFSLAVLSAGMIVLAWWAGIFSDLLEFVSKRILFITSE